jgi:LmbE family N-acetylglucosaminyl deacetylase
LFLIGDRLHSTQIRVPEVRQRQRSHRARPRTLFFACIVVCFASSVWGGPQEPAHAGATQAGKPPAASLQPDSPTSDSRPDGLLPEDNGASGLKEMLLRLGTTARMLQVTAHPDDEDGGMLTLESRGKGVTTTLLTLNRGEGGQNKVGSNLFDVLGVLRTLELLAADRYYGVEQRFTRVADFGFSKTPEETFQKWGGHDVALADMVRVIRTFRPDVIVARFSGTERDGHGHHQASSILSREAFHAAADPKRFPDQIDQGLLPWQAKKLYIGNVCGFGASSCPDENYTLRLNTGEADPALGMSYVQFALAGLRHQLSQGAGGWSVDPGPRYTYYRLVDSVLPPRVPPNGHENNFFDGIDVTLPGLANRLGDDASKLPHFRSELQRIQTEVETASHDNAPRRAAMPLLSALKTFHGLITAVEKSSLEEREKLDLLTVLREKSGQCETAANFAMGISMEVTVAPPKGPERGLPSEADASTVVSPGQRLTVLIKFHNGSKYPLKIEKLSLESSQDWVTGTYKGDNRSFVKPGEDFYANFRLRVPVDAPTTRPYWHRNDPETESLNTIDDENYATLPFPPPPLRVRADYRITGRADLAVVGIQVKGTDGPSGAIAAPVLVPFTDENGKERNRDLAVAPAFSVMLEPGTQVISTNENSGKAVEVGVSSNVTGLRKGTLRLDVPSGWNVDPPQVAVEFHRRGEKQDFEFKIFPDNLREGKIDVRAVLESDGKRFTEGYSLVTREDLGAFYYYQPALQRVSMVDVKISPQLKVAYVMGAGDDIPTVLKQIGIDVTLLPAEKLATEDLSKYGTIVLGIRAYDTQKDLVANNNKLINYVSNGGTLVVQYNAGVGDFNKENLTPYPAQLSRERVTVEEAPVEILQSGDRVFHFPNQIAAHDFDGWVQERGLYFMDKWDDHFNPLLACNDPGQPEQKGGLLRAQFGKGTYIYTGYAFFRQLPDGVPGAVRLFVNLLSAGHEAPAAVAQISRRDSRPRLSEPGKARLPELFRDLR